MLYTMKDLNLALASLKISKDSLESVSIITEDLVKHQLCIKEKLDVVIENLRTTLEVTGESDQLSQETKDKLSQAYERGYRSRSRELGDGDAVKLLRIEGQETDDSFARTACVKLVEEKGRHSTSFF